MWRTTRKFLDRCDVVFLSLRAQAAHETLSSLVFRANQTVISVMAGVPLAALTEHCAPGLLPRPPLEAHGSRLRSPWDLRALGEYEQERRGGGDQDKADQEPLRQICEYWIRFRLIPSSSPFWWCFSSSIAIDWVSGVWPPKLKDIPHFYFPG
jgi:hypothetical protein